MKWKSAWHQIWIGFWVAWVALTLAFPVSSMHAVADDNPPPSGFPSSVGDFFERALVMLEGASWILSDEEIDRMVGDPWTMKPVTAAKFNVLPSTVRMALLSGIVDRFQNIDLVASGGADAVFSQAPAVLVMNQDASRTLINSMLSTLTGHFNAEELVDLGVYLLSKFSFFPKTMAEWNQAKRHFVQYDLWLGLAAILGTMLATNNGTLTVSGWLVKLGKGKEPFRLGFYTSVKHVGAKMHQTASYGMKLSFAGFYGRALVVDRPVTEMEKKTVEFSLSKYWIRVPGKTNGWEFAASVLGKYLWEHGDPKREGDFILRASGFARKMGLFDDPYLALLMSADFQTNFKEEHSVLVSTGIEDNSSGIAALVRGGVAVDREGTRVGHLGVTVGGPFEPRGRFIDRRMVSCAGRLKETVRSAQRKEKLIWETLEKMLHFGTGAYTENEERNLVYELQVRERALKKANESLKRALDSYLVSRNEYYRISGRDPQTLTMRDTILDRPIFEYAMRKFYPKKVLEEEMAGARKDRKPGGPIRLIRSSS